MKITTKGRYALKAILFLAVNGQGTPISIKEISNSEKISPEFLEQLFFKLKKADLIASIRGPGGGFSLNKPLEKITVKDVFDAVGEGLEMSPCTCETEAPCNEQGDCLSFDVWKTAADQLKDYFSTLSLKSIVEGKAKDFWNASA